MTKVMLLCDQIDRMEVSTNFVRSMRFRAPALTAYAEVLAEMETGHLLSVAPTNQKLQSKKAVNPNYPVNLYLCDHPEDASRRHGNKHGRFRDCLLCGMVFKAMAEDYHVPISEDKVPVFLEHGRRSKPGGKVMALPHESGTQPARHPL